MTEERLVRRTTVVQKLRHLLLGISFSHIGNVDASGGVCSLVQGNVRVWLLLRWCSHRHGRPSDENIRGIDGVTKGCCHPVVVVAQLDSNHNRMFGVGYQEYILERAGSLFGFVGCQPFLKERRERMTVECITCLRVFDGQLAVAFEW